MEVEVELELDGIVETKSIVKKTTTLSSKRKFSED
jgi:hypothetical protein